MSLPLFMSLEVSVKKKRGIVMDLGNLELKMYKNYKELCSVLNETVKGGKSKILQLADWERYFKYEKNGNKYLITNIYKEPLPKIDERRSEYHDDLRDIILYYLSTQKKNSVLLSFSTIIRLTNMANENYIMGRKYLNETSEMLDIERDYLRSFYGISKNKFVSIFDVCMSRMEKEALVFVKRCLGVKRRLVELETNELGQPIVTKNGIKHKISYVYDEATDSETEMILKIKREIMDELGVKDEQECYMKGKWHIYDEELKSQLNSKLNIEYCYKAYKLILNKDAIVKKVTKIRNKLAKDNINDMICNSFDDSKNKSLNTNSDGKDLLIELFINANTNLCMEKLLNGYTLSHLTELEYDEVNVDADEEFYAFITS